MRGILTAVLATALPGAVWAQCPTAQDLQDGVFVTYDDGSYTQYTGEVGGKIDELTFITDGSGDTYFVPTISGLFATGYIDGPGGTLDESTRETVTFSEDLGQYLPVAAGLEFSVGSIRRYTGGGSREKRYDVAVGPEKVVDIAGCAYTALPVTHGFTDADGRSVLTQDYLPELGIGIYTSYADAGGAPDRYRVLEISSWSPL